MNWNCHQQLSRYITLVIFFGKKLLHCISFVPSKKSYMQNVYPAIGMMLIVCYSISLPIFMIQKKQCIT